MKARWAAYDCGADPSVPVLLMDGLPPPMADDGEKASEDVANRTADRAAAWKKSSMIQRMSDTRVTECNNENCNQVVKSGPRQQQRFQLETMRLLLPAACRSSSQHVVLVEIRRAPCSSSKISGLRWPSVRQSTLNLLRVSKDTLHASAILAS